MPNTLKILPRFLNNLFEDPDCLVVGHVLEGDAVDLKDHVARLDATVQSNSAA